MRVPYPLDSIHYRHTEVVVCSYYRSSSSSSNSGSHEPGTRHKACLTTASAKSMLEGMADKRPAPGGRAARAVDCRV